MSNSPPLPIKAKAKARRESILDQWVAHSSLVSSSPIAQEILASDLAECSDHHEHGDDGWETDDGSDYEATQHDDPLPLFLHARPNGVSFGPGRPTIADPVAEAAENLPVLTARELVESRNAERSLLRDNHILPPKHPRSANEPLLRQLYRRLFSTKVPVPDDRLGPVIGRVSTKEIDEAAPLLAEVHPGYLSVPIDDNDNDDDDNDNDDDDDDDGKPLDEDGSHWEAVVPVDVLRTTWQREAMTLTQFARSLIVTFLLHYSVTITSVFTVGRIGTLELGAVSLATMTANITCYAPVQGLSTCLDTLCAQAYGSGHKHLVGLQLQRMTLILWILLVPIGVLWYFAGPILGSIIPDQQTAALAGLYLRVLIIGTPGVAAFESGKRFVQAQGLFHATTYVLLIGAPLNVLVSWFLVWRMGWGFTGAASAVAFTQNLLPVLLVLYVRYIDGSECWAGFSRRAFSNWGQMMKLALPGMIMVEAQYFAFEILTLAGSQFGSAHLAAQSILVTMTSTTSNIPFPLSIAAATRVANLIGARLSGAARTSAKVALVASILVGLFNLALLATLRSQLPRLFTSDKEVADIVERVVPTVAIMQIFDSLAAMSHSLLRGIGRQAVGGYTNLGSYYLIAVPISFATAFGLGWKLDGLWFGITIGLAVVSSVELFYLYQADWEHAVEEAEMRLRLDHDHGPVVTEP